MVDVGIFDKRNQIKKKDKMPTKNKPKVVCESCTICPLGSTHGRILILIGIILIILKNNILNYIGFTLIILAYILPLIKKR